MKKVNVPLGFSLVPRMGDKCEECYFFDSKDGRAVDCDHVCCLSEERGEFQDVIYKLVKTKYAEVENERKTN